MEDFRQKSQKLARANQGRSSCSACSVRWCICFYVSSILCLFYLGGMGHPWAQRQLSGSDHFQRLFIVTFILYISKFFTPIQNLAEAVQLATVAALASAEKVFSIMDIQPRMQDAPR